MNAEWMAVCKTAWEIPDHIMVHQNSKATSETVFSFIVHKGHTVGVLTCEWLCVMHG